MFAAIKNGLILKHSFIMCPRKKISAAFLNVLWDEGFILGYKISKVNSKMFKIFLTFKKRKPLIRSLKIITKPGHKIYYSVNQLWKIKPENGILIVSTNKGLLSINACKKLGIGGEPFLIIK